MQLYTIDQETGCWNWNRSILPSGYGNVRIDNRLWTAHRIVWALHHNQDPPKGTVICHSCDNRRCINPAHLFIGSYKDNSQDSCSKGRNRKKLSPAQVKEIRSLSLAGMKGNALAKQFNVSSTLISYIIRGLQSSTLPKTLPERIEPIAR